MLLCKFGQNPSIGFQDIELERLISTVFMDSWPWKLGQGHQNLINSEPPPNNALVQVCSKSIHLFRRYRVRKPNLISFHGLVTLKMRSRSPKSNQLFPPSQPCIYASLVKIHPLVQKISRKKEATRTRTPTRTRTRTPTPTPTPTPTGTAPKTICPPPSVGGT